MNTDERMELGAKLKREMNCCQAVVSAFADTVDVEGTTLHRIAGGFGSGMGTTEGNCGALGGAVMVTSLRAPAGGAMALSRKVLPRFKELCGGATICRELKGIGTGKVLCSCENCVRNAIKAASEALGDE